MPRTTKPKPKPKPKKTRNRNRVKEGLLDKSEYGKEFPLKDDPVFNKLNHRQKRFVYNIFLQPITNWSNGKCYQEAYNNPNIDQCYVNAMGSLRKPNIMHCIDIIKEKYSTELYTSVNRILREEASIAYSDPGELFDASGHLILPIRDLPKHVRKSIKGFEVIENERTGITKYKVFLWDKGHSLGRLESIAGMNAPKKHELSGPGGGPIRHDIRKIEIILVRPDNIKDENERNSKE